MKDLVKQVLNFRAQKVVGSKDFQARQNELLVLMYHGVVEKQPDLADWCVIEDHVFDKHLVQLKKYFEILPASEALKKLAEGTIDKPTAVITFDDGYANNFEVALPILARHNVPACIFLTTNLLDTDNTIWTARLQSAFGHTSEQSIAWRGKTYELTTINQRAAAVSDVKRLLKAEHFSVIAAQTSLLEDMLQSRFSPPSPDYDCYRMLSSDMVRKLALSNLIELGAHTLHHPILAHLDKNEQHTEITESIRMVEELTRKPCNLFAYPNGSRSDYNQTTVDILEQSNATYAFTTEPGVNNPTTPPFELVRYGVGNNAVFFRELYSHYS